MKYKFSIVWFLAVLVFMVAFSFVLANTVFAAPAVQASAPSINDVWMIFIALVGWPAFRVAAINLLKYVGLPDGSAGKISYAADVVFFGIVAYLVFSGQLTFVTGLDALLGNLAVLIGNILIVLGGFSGSRTVGKFIYSHTRGDTLLGYHHTPTR